MILILNQYEKASGEILNKEKTSLFFGKNTPTDVKHNITLIGGVKAHGSFEKYLGLPAVMGKNKTKCFQNLVDRTQNRILNWKAKFWSNAGKEILIKAVLQEIPSYSMSIFLLPKKTVTKLHLLIRSCWLGFNGDHSKVHWLEWRKLGVSKEQGGLGFRNIYIFNLALISKQR